MDAVTAHEFPQDRFFAIVRKIEQTWPVHDWLIDGIQIWPIARNILHASVTHLSLSIGDTPVQDKRPNYARAKTGLAAVWNLLRHCGTDLVRPSGSTRKLNPADVICVSDGWCFDLTDNFWQNRYFEPLLEEFDRIGRSSLLMRVGGTTPNPILRRVVSLDMLLASARLRAWTKAYRPRQISLPAYDDVVEFISGQDIATEFLSIRKLGNRAALVRSIADRLERVLRIVSPQMVFMVSYYGNVGFALCLACRRLGILSIDIQHGSQGGQHEAYNQWHRVPSRGFNTMPAGFWNWMKEDERRISEWSSQIREPWHRSIWAGHPQVAARRTSSNVIQSICGQSPARLEILVALQDIDRYRYIWDGLAELINASPLDWRWWLRRHPSLAYDRGVSTKSLLAIRQPNVIIKGASSLPLATLLPHMDVLLTARSSAVLEAAMLGIKSIFLTEEARSVLQSTIDVGHAEVVVDMPRVSAKLYALSQHDRKPHTEIEWPKIEQTLAHLDEWAEDYRALTMAQRVTH